jgi:hypothetical protein
MSCRGLNDYLPRSLPEMRPNSVLDGKIAEKLGRRNVYEVASPQLTLFMVNFANFATVANLAAKLISRVDFPDCR